MTQPTSGYVSCACRDCMEVAIANAGERALCACCAECACDDGGRMECFARDVSEVDYDCEPLSDVHGRL